MSESPAIATGVSGSNLPAVADCWNSIGTQGNSSCAELEKVIHCRNCAIYSRAALQLLNRPLPEGYRREWTEHLARPSDLARGARTSTVVFRLHGQWFALPTYLLQEVAEQRAVHSIPHRRQGVLLGLVNIRGEL